MSELRYPEDKFKFYRLKDSILEILYKENPAGLKRELKLVPFLVRCPRCKDRAGARKRDDDNAWGFDYYLNQVELCPNDRQIPERATIEMVLRRAADRNIP